MTQQVELYGISLKEWRNMFMLYEFALEEVNTKLRILSKECTMMHKRNPIEHMKSRVKNFESISSKLERKGQVVSIENARKKLKDIAGIRIICSFTEDIYLIANMIEKQDDIKVVEMKDYIRYPKGNGYRSLHLVIEIPIFLSTGVEHILVEVQIRTSAMDFWASLEHKMYYKYNDSKKGMKLTEELKEIAETMAALDQRMIAIKEEIEKNDE